MPETTKVFPPKITTEPMGCVSTGNITERDGRLLADPAVKLPCLLYRNDESCMFWVEQHIDAIGSILNSLSDAGLSREFQAIYLLARDEKLQYLRFDRDGQLIPGYPEFKW